MYSTHPTPAQPSLTRHRFAPGDEVRLPCGADGVIQALLPANHYRVSNLASGALTEEHDYSLAAKPQANRASSPQPAARSAAALWAGAERRRPRP